MAKAGEYLMSVRNATGWTGARHNVYVNGVNQGKLNYPQLGWNRFSTVGMLVTLNAGSNTVKFQKDSTDDQYAEIDYISIGVRLEAEEGVLSGTGTVYFHEPQASGAAEAAGIDTAGTSSPRHRSGCAWPPVATHSGSPRAPASGPTPPNSTSSRCAPD